MSEKLSKMLKAHAKIRAARSELSAKFKAEDSKLKRQIEVIETHFLKIMNETGSDQLKVKGVGMAFRTERVLPKANDWGAIFTHVQESGNFDLLQKRLAQGGVKEFMELHDGDTPPGVSITVERGVSVRRES